jgi:hypothetical protein
VPALLDCLCGGIDFFLKNCYSYTMYPHKFIGVFLYFMPYKISLVSVASQMSPAQVAKRFSMGKIWLLNWIGRFW